MSDTEKSAQAQPNESAEPSFRYNAKLAQGIEEKWQKIWDDEGTFWAANVNGDLKDGKGRNADGRPAYFAMDMFPYPSGKGLHVGHPLGYLATDVVSRYHRMKGENVLHAMGYDAFGLPAEQYAVQTGQHPRITTEQNIANMRRQLHRMGLSFDNRRSFATIDPGYVRWTQWIFSRIYDSWYDEDATNPSGSRGCARPISTLVEQFESGKRAIPGFEGKAWADLSEAEQADVLNDFRLAYISKSPVNWCPGLGTVLANEEVTAEGKSERGNFPVFQRELRQWSMRITAYGHRLIEDLDTIDWPEKVKLMQRNWIGESHGASVHFDVETPNGVKDMEIYTTRPDTLFGTTFAVVSPEHHLLENVPAEWPADVPEDWKGGYATPVEAVKAYRLAAEAKTAKDRVNEAGEKTGLFTGLYATNPITGAKLPLFTADYVLMDYGTGAIMAVPGGDQRDYDFAVKFGLPVIYTVTPLPDSGDDLANYEGKAPFVSHDGIVINSSIDATKAKGDSLSLDGLRVDEAIDKVNAWLESAGVGKGTVSYRLRDWLFSRQRYWGEPIPLVNCPKCGWVPVPEEELPLVLPQVDSYELTDDGESPLSKMTDWVNTKCPKCGCDAKRETDTMPQWAGSSWYFLRYMDPHNDHEPVSHEAEQYWGPVDWYNGGMEHTTLHLLYSRFWHKFLYDIGVVHTKEPYAKRTSHGMILGQNPHYVGNVSTQEEKDALIAKYGNQALRPAVKMSKSLGNVVNPDDVVKAYGADTMRLYIMFIGDFEKVATWSDDAVKGCKRFLDRVWNLADQVTEEDGVSEKNAPIVHKTIKKVTDDIDTLKMNTAIAALMAMVNEFYSNGLSRGDFEALLLMLSPFAPHMVEELWEQKGFAAKYEGKMAMQCAWPEYDESKTVASSVEMAVQVSGKFKGTIIVPVDSDQDTVVEAAKASEKVAKAIAGMQIVKVIHVKNKLVNLIVKPC